MPIKCKHTGKVPAPLTQKVPVAWQLRERELVLFACNDNPDPSSAGGGSHW